VDENIPLDVVKDICLPRQVSFGGNLQLTSVLLLGSPLDAQRNALDCMEIGGESGFVLAPGCDLPFQTPPENLEAVTQIVHDPYQRDVARAMAVQESDEPCLDMQEYGQSDQVVIDIITLDSEACAPCQYMVEAVKAVTTDFTGIVAWREHKIKDKQSLLIMKSLGVRNLPTICIDGQIAFVSRIPAHDELRAAIQRRINDKLRARIKRQRAKLYLLGEEGDTFTELHRNVEQAVTELGADLSVHTVIDKDGIDDFGLEISQTPAVVLVRHELKSSNVVVDVSIIKQWIKDLNR
jgi:uroporphyrinogen decarboxylase